MTVNRLETSVNLFHPLRVTDMEARIGFEPTYNGFANRCLTTWLPRPCSVKRSPPPILLQSEFVSGGSQDFPAKTASLFATFNGIGESFEEAFSKDEAVRQSAGVIGYRVHRNLEDANMLVLEFIAADVPTLRSYLKNSQLGKLPSAPKGRIDFLIGDDSGHSLAR